MGYVVSKYDPSDEPHREGDWTEVARVDRPMQMRPAIRALLAHGYGNVSIAIDATDPRRRDAGRYR